ncbi:hydroxyacylglutathione hydrolase [Punctularia strigosozonata HHB-11173 SS5]|uniref:hydroxyacylglutathione hydrolase n=1 Tax=Punctularia strigosozonata (strain HHB-11173) TaxID=741275 RepID=UPI0004417855|nr:hydroxyacylglutathione hydrolase [Punctularia strigosozonata HHB-11173 SS5]EIN07722.1 hydroxyacylglutathione hydrolase [Punctularia strigosozonata HHB-11173 SS5]
MKVVPVPVRSDNYAYLLIDEAAKKAAAVDPYDVPKVQEAAKKLGVELVGVLTTHHHHDHAGGNEVFSKAYPSAPIYGGSKQVAAVTHVVKDKDEFTIADGIHVKCLATPCHTQDSICYHVTSTSSSPSSPSSPHPGGVFTGDTLFLAGCGRFFEGTGAEMVRALAYLSSTLPDATVVYNGHEYTKGNVAFARSVDPENEEIARLARLVEESERGEVTGKTTIGEEKGWNVFMRLKTEPVLTAMGVTADSPEDVIMDKLRDAKNAFRG